MEDDLAGRKVKCVPRSPDCGLRQRANRGPRQCVVTSKAQYKNTGGQIKSRALNNGHDCYRRTGETYKNNRRTTVEVRTRLNYGHWDRSAVLHGTLVALQSDLERSLGAAVFDARDAALAVGDENNAIQPSATILFLMLGLMLCRCDGTHRRAPHPVSRHYRPRTARPHRLQNERAPLSILQQPPPAPVRARLGHALPASPPNRQGAAKRCPRGRVAG